VKDQEQQPSKHSLRALDWLNFFLADVQTGVGPFLAIYLAGYAWDEERIGLALSVGGIAGILAQTPAGALVDQVHQKRTVIAVGVGALALGALLIAFLPTFWSVLSAQVLIGATSSIFIPAICAISLGIVGHRMFDARQGRNQSFNSAGNVFAAVSMGLLGYFVSNRSIFFFVVLCTLPTFLALRKILADEIDYERARGAKKGADDGKPARAAALLKDRPLVIFLICAVMFHFANAAMLPLLGEMLAKGHGRSSMMFMSACVVTTQFTITMICRLVRPQSTFLGKEAAAHDRFWRTADTGGSLHTHREHGCISRDPNPRWRWGGHIRRSLYTRDRRPDTRVRTIQCHTWRDRYGSRHRRCS
jgi:MFS family permease